MDPIWSSLIHFDPIRSSLNKFDQVWSCLIKFDQVWTTCFKIAQKCSKFSKMVDDDDDEKLFLRPRAKLCSRSKSTSSYAWKFNWVKRKDRVSNFSTRLSFLQLAISQWFEIDFEFAKQIRPRMIKKLRLKLQKSFQPIVNILT